MKSEKKILIVSDESELLGLLQHNLPGRDCQVTSIGDTEDDLKEMVDHFMPDLIILDIFMPWLDGIEVCLRLRQWCQAPVIMLSTFDAGQNTVRSLDINSDSFLTEPYGLNELKAQIENTLSRN